MDFLKAEIEKRKRKEAPPANGTTTEAKPDPNQPKKYVRRGEFEKERERKYFEEQEEERKRKEELQRKREEELERENQRVHIKKPVQEQKTEQIPEYFKNPSEVIKRLRARGEVVTYFGESDDERADRLKKLEEREPAEEAGSGSAVNEFAKTLKKVKEDDEKDAPKKVEKKEENVTTPPENEGPILPAVICREDFSLKVLRQYMREWKAELESRSESQKRSAQGKIDTATYVQTKAHIKPLYRQLKQKTLADDLLTPIHEIAQYLPEREYVKAHDAYLKMAIGNAPWPMGVTMVGIHERSAREKIHSDQIAHVLNDESQRKYIQAVKRLMTFCQRVYPTDPSKTVG